LHIFRNKNSEIINVKCPGSLVDGLRIRCKESNVDILGSRFEAGTSYMQMSLFVFELRCPG
jgi:hypothetical protein